MYLCQDSSANSSILSFGLEKLPYGTPLGDNTATLCSILVHRPPNKLGYQAKL